MLCLLPTRSGIPPPLTPLSHTPLSIALPLPDYTSPPKVSWSQTDDDVEVIIALPKGVKGRDISVTMKYNLIQFRLKNGFSMSDDDEKKDSSTETGATLLQRLQSGLTPYSPIDPDLSTWSLVDGNLVISLTKKKSLWHWRALYKRER